MKEQLQVVAGTTVYVKLTPPVGLSEGAGFDWLVTELRLTATLLPLQGGCTSRRNGIPVLIASGEGECDTATATVELSCRFEAPAQAGAYRLVFLIQGVADPALRLELDAANLFVRASSSRGSRAPANR